MGKLWNNIKKPNVCFTGALKEKSEKQRSILRNNGQIFRNSIKTIKPQILEVQ